MLIICVVCCDNSDITYVRKIASSIAAVITEIENTLYLDLVYVAALILLVRSRDVNKISTSKTKLCGEHQVNFHSFVDDSQTYVNCLPIDVDNVVCQLEGCIREVGLWMSANHLKLNTDKTDVGLVWTLSGLVPGIT